MMNNENPIQVGMLSDEKYKRMHDISRRVYSPFGIAPTIHTCQGEYRNQDNRGTK